MPSDLDSLVSMGFPEPRVRKALLVTKNAGLQPAMDWLVANPDDDGSSQTVPTGNTLSGTGAGASASAAAATTAAGNATSGSPDDLDEEEPPAASDDAANSLQCDDCGRKLRDTQAAQIHAARTGHQNFSQSTEELKQLTEEEKKQKLEELKVRMALKRAEKQELDKQQALEAEKIRRMRGKELVEAKEKAKDLELKKALEQKKREKEEERRAKERIKAQIEEDRRARAVKAEEEKRLRAGEPLASASSASGSGAAISTTTASKDYDECRLQLRPMGGAGGPLTQQFRADQPLQDVFQYLRQNGHPTVSSVSTTFPRKQYGASDSSKTLKELEKPVDKIHGSYHWQLERILSVAVLPLCVVPLFSGPSKTVDFLLGFLMPLHCHLGFGQIVMDYLNKRKMGPIGNRLLVATLYAATALTTYGLYQFNTNDIGITEFIKRLWQGKQVATEKAGASKKSTA